MSLSSKTSRAAPLLICEMLGTTGVVIAFADDVQLTAGLVLVLFATFEMLERLR